MLQQHSEKVRMKSEVEGFLTDENPWIALLSPEEEYAVQILVITQRKAEDEAEYIVRGERLRRRLPKREAGKLVILEGEVVEVLGKHDRRQDTRGADAEAILSGDAEVMVHVRNSEGIEAWTRQGSVESLLPAS
jgi:hypothetical protein